MIELEEEKDLLMRSGSILLGYEDEVDDMGDQEQRAPAVEDDISRK